MHLYSMLIIVICTLIMTLIPFKNDDNLTPLWKTPLLDILAPLTGHGAPAGTEWDQSLKTTLDFPSARQS